MNLYNYINKVKNDEEKVIEQPSFDFLELESLNISQSKVDLMRDVYSVISSSVFIYAGTRFLTEPNSEIYLQKVTTDKNGRFDCLYKYRNYDTKNEKAISYEDFMKEYRKSRVIGEQRYTIINFQDIYPIIYFCYGKIYMQPKTARYINALNNDAFGFGLAKECVRLREEEKLLLDADYIREKKELEKIMLLRQKIKRDQ